MGMFTAKAEPHQDWLTTCARTLPKRMGTHKYTRAHEHTCTGTRAQTCKPCAPMRILLHMRARIHTHTWAHPNAHRCTYGRKHTSPYAHVVARTQIQQCRHTRIHASRGCPHTPANKHFTIKQNMLKCNQNPSLQNRPRKKL